MGGGGDFTLNIPDYKIYKVENCPSLNFIQEKLAQEGLKDPWMRNHVWRYENKITNDGKCKFYKRFWLPGTFRGISIGFMVVGAYIATDVLFGSKDKGHGH